MTFYDRVVQDPTALFKPILVNNFTPIKQKLNDMGVNYPLANGYKEHLEEMYANGQKKEVFNILNVPFQVNNGPQDAQEFFAEFGKEGESLIQARNYAVEAFKNNGKSPEQNLQEIKTAKELTPMVVVIIILITIVFNA